jgi:hypothetical protein
MDKLLADFKGNPALGDRGLAGTNHLAPWGAAGLDRIGVHSGRAIPEFSVSIGAAVTRTIPGANQCHGNDWVVPSSVKILSAAHFLRLNLNPDRFPID